MKANRPYCPNCHFPLRQRDAYCAHCGQKRTDKRVTLGLLLGDFFSTLFNFDGQVFRTLGALFVPGKLTEAYFAGQHQRYVKPVRLFLALITGFLALLFFVVPTQDLDGSDDIGLAGERLELAVWETEMADAMNELRQTMQPGMTPGGRAALDTFYHRFWDSERADSMVLVTWRGIREDFADGELDTGAPSDVYLGGYRVAKADMYYLELDTLLELYNLTQPLDRFVVERQYRFLENGSNFNRYLVGNLFWLAIFIPLTMALVFKLLYIRQQRFFVEHLIFNFHYYAFVYVAGALAFLPTIRETTAFIPLLLIAIFGYLWWAMRRVYQQGWIKTTFKLFLAFFALQIFLIPVLLVWLVVNMLIF